MDASWERQRALWDNREGLSYPKDVTGSEGGGRLRASLRNRCSSELYPSSTLTQRWLGSHLRKPSVVYHSADNILGLCYWMFSLYCWEILHFKNIKLVLYFILFVWLLIHITIRNMAWILNSCYKHSPLNEYLSKRSNKLDETYGQDYALILFWFLFSLVPSHRPQPIYTRYYQNTEQNAVPKHLQFNIKQIITDRLVLEVIQKKGQKAPWMIDEMSFGPNTISTQSSFCSVQELKLMIYI